MDPRTCIGKLSLLVLIGAFAASQPAIAATDNGTLTVGGTFFGTSVCASIPPVLSGFSTSPGVGSYSPIGLTGGKSAYFLFDLYDYGCSDVSGLSVTGFSSNPGAAWLTSVTCNGVTQPGGAGAGFAYLNGQATWSWGALFGFRFIHGSNVSCTIVHN